MILLDMLVDRNDEMFRKVSELKKYAQETEFRESDDPRLVFENIFLRAYIVVQESKMLFDMAVLAYSYDLINDETMEEYVALTYSVENFCDEISKKFSYGGIKE